MEMIKTIHYLPLGLNRIITYKGKTIYFNKDLWEDLGLIFYGDHNIIS